MPYTKTVGRLTGSDSIRLTYQSNGGGKLVYVPHRISIPRDSTSSVTFGDNIPDWKARIARRQNANTSLIGTVYETHNRRSAPLSAQCLIHHNSNTVAVGVPYALMQWHSGNPLAFLQTPSASFVGLSLTQAINLAKTRALKKAIQAQRQFQGGVFLGELTEALRLIKRPASSLRSETDKLINRWSKYSKKVRYSPQLKNLPPSNLKVKKALKSAASQTWLEWSFGVKPLVHDIQDAARAAAEIKFHTRPPSKVVNGRAKVILTNPSTIINEDKDCIRWKGSSKLTTAAECRYQISVLTDMSGYTYNNNLGVLGLDFGSVVPTIWELIPYSFLVDYFTNIGDLLEAYSFNQAAVNWAIQHTAFTRRRAIVSVDAELGTIPFDYTNRAPTFSRSLGDYNAWIEVREVTRATVQGPILPSLAFEIPGFKSRKWLNIGALVMSRNQAANYRIRGD